MQTVRRWSVVVLWHLTTAVSAMAQTTAPAEEVEEVRLHAGAEGEYQQLLELRDLSPEQLTTIRQKLAERKQTLEGWVNSPRGQELIRLRTELAAARREKRMEEARRLRQQIQPLSAEYFQVREKTRVDVLKALTPEQLTIYAGEALRLRSMRGWERLQLTDSQNAEVRELARERAAAYLAATPLDRDPFFRGFEPIVPELRKAVHETILTTEQKQALKLQSAPAALENQKTTPSDALVPPEPQ